MVKDGVCTECGDGVLNNGEHIDPERHLRNKAMQIVWEVLRFYGEDAEEAECIADDIIGVLEVEECLRLQN